MTIGHQKHRADNRSCVAMQKRSPPSTRISGRDPRARQGGGQTLRSGHWRADRFTKIVVVRLRAVACAILSRRHCDRPSVGAEQEDGCGFVRSNLLTLVIGLVLPNKRDALAAAEDASRSPALRSQEDSTELRPGPAVRTWRFFSRPFVAHCSTCPPSAHFIAGRNAHFTADNDGAGRHQ